jgi:hypothetical protein
MPAKIQNQVSRKSMRDLPKPGGQGDQGSTGPITAPDGESSLPQPEAAHGNESLWGATICGTICGWRLGLHHEPEANRQLQPLCFWNRSTNPARRAQRGRVQPATATWRMTTPIAARCDRSRHNEVSRTPPKARESG